MVSYLFLSPFSPFTLLTGQSTVLVQTVAVAVGSMPLSAGFVGVIPALEKLLKPEEGGPLRVGTPQLMFWSIGVAFFGVFFAVPLRRQVIIKEKLKFPSGTATALMISVLHRDEKRAAGGADRGEREGLVSSMGGEEAREGDREAQEDAETKESWRQKTRLLVYSFALSGSYVCLPFPGAVTTMIGWLIHDRPSSPTSFPSSETSQSSAPPPQASGSGR